jgi:hypothetical protein
MVEKLFVLPLLRLLLHLFLLDLLLLGDLHLRDL